jgi:glycosyltransferase involved in cell wall biosynthesis
MNTQTLSSRPKRLLFVHSSDELYGSDVVLWHLVTGLDRQRFEPIVVLPSDIPYEGKLSAALEQAGVIHYSIKMGVIRRRYFNPAGMVHYLAYLGYGTWQLALLVRRHHINLIHSNTSAVLGGALVARLFGLPHVWHIHEILEQPAWVGRLIYRIVLANSTKVVAISHAVARHINQRGDQPNIEIISDGVDCTRFRPHVDGQSFRDRWGVRSGEVVVGVVGRISHWKGQELFLEAAGKTAALCPQIRFAIVGDPVPGDESRLVNLRAQANQLGLADKVIFQAFTENAPEIMRALDILVLPSTLPEPLGLVALEAMASERPVIAAGHGGSLEIVISGENGLLFPPGDSNALAQAIIRLATDSERRKHLALRGRQQVVEHFSLKEFRQKFTRLYTNLIC